MRFFVVALVCVLGCEGKQTAPKLKPPTLAEAEAFGRDFEKAFTPCKGEALERAVDFDLVIKRAVAGRETTEGITEGLRSAFNGTALCAQFAESAFHYLRTLDVAGSPQPLYRVRIGEGVNYIQLELDTRSGKPKIADWYVFMTGERVSESLATLLESMINAGASTKQFDAMDRLKRQMAAKQFEEARETLHSLPAKLRRSKHFMLQEVMIVSDLGDNDEYLRVLTEFEKTFPNDASLDLVRIDGLFLRKDYDQLLVVIDRLDKRIGGDPYLDVLRSGIYRLLDKPTEALAAAKRATVAEPTLEDGWWQLFTEQCAAQQFADALPTLETLRDKFGSPTDAESLAADPRFTAFAASPEYAAWIEKAPR